MNEKLNSDPSAPPEPRRRMTNMTMVTQSMALHLANAHRIHAASLVPPNVVIEPDALVTAVEKDGRITGVWVDAKVFVRLRPEQ